MNENVHLALDGELSPAELSLPERERLARLDSAVALVAGHLRSAPAPDLAAAVMRQIASPRPEAFWKRGLAWLWSPRPIRLSVRPAYGFALAAIALVLLPLSLEMGKVTPAAPAAVAATAPPVYVQFRLDAENASTVSLAGSFTDWKPSYRLRETAPGVWSVLVPLEPGVYDYSFVVDGDEWVADPSAPQVDDSFGGTNSRLSLPALREAA